MLDPVEIGFENDGDTRDELFELFELYELPEFCSKELESGDPMEKLAPCPMALFEVFREAGVLEVVAGTLLLLLLLLLLKEFVFSKIEEEDDWDKEGLLNCFSSFNTSA